MNKMHEDMLRRNHCALMRMNFKAMWPKLIHYGVFPREYIEHYQTLPDDKARRNTLFDLVGRGPNAFELFVRCLRETSQHVLAHRLLGIPTAPNELINTITLHEREEPTANTANTEPDHIVIKVKINDEFKDDFSAIIKPYTMRSFTRGAVLIINNTSFIDEPERRGAHVDQENLTQLFTQMGGYNMRILENVTEKQLKDGIIEFTKDDILKSVNIAFVVVMSHGSEIRNESYVKCVDGSYVATGWIESQFYRENCPLLHSKPKIIVYQICRGLGEDKGVKLVDNLDNKDKETEMDGVANIPVRKHSDILLCHSTTKGYRAHRHTSKGSWYILSICKVFMNYACDYHIEDLFHMVDREISTWQSEVNRTMQTTAFYNYGFRHCFLNPGVYERDGEMYRFPKY